MDNCRVPGNFKEDNSSNISKKWLSVGLKSYAEEFAPITDEKGEVHQKYKKQDRGCHHILFKENCIIKCMKKVY